MQIWFKNRINYCHWFILTNAEDMRSPNIRHNSEIWWAASSASTLHPLLISSDFHLFSLLKKILGGKHFTHNERMWLRQQPKEFHAAGIGALTKK